MLTEQRIRTILFYLSMAIFLIGLPFILSFALGYKFNTHTLRFVKAGLIFIKTQPSGAGVYLGNRLLAEKTPLTINELLPGNYRLKVELQEYYPWSADVNVEAGKVMRLDKIILFPLRPDVKQINPNRLSSFWIDDKRGIIYYLGEEDNSIYESDLDGEALKKIVKLPFLLNLPIRWRLSQDEKSLACFNAHQILVVSLEQEQVFFFKYPQQDIVEVFWHSDSYHLIVVARSNIEILEPRPNSLPINLVVLNNQENSAAFYDANNDTVYFLDSQMASDGKLYDNIYKLELGSKFSGLRDLMKLRPLDQEPRINGTPQSPFHFKGLIRPEADGK